MTKAEKFILIAKREPDIYETGKSDGYTEGYEAGKAEGGDTESAYNEGFDAGKTEGIAIGESLFSSMINRTIEEVTVPEGVTVIGDYAFGGCTKLKSASLPNGITQIGKFAFYVCGVLEEIVVPDGCLTIGGSAFSGCFKLARVVLPDSITAIGSTAFNGSIITEFIFPDKVDRIEDRILIGCSKLERVVAPSACKYVEEYAFGNCTACMTYDFSKCKQVPSLLSTLAFNNIASGAKIYVPTELYDSWIVATNWVAFKDYIVAT